MSLKIEKLRADFQEKVIKGKYQVQYVIGIPEIEALFAEIDNLQKRVDRWEPTIGARASMLGRSQ